MLRRAYVDGRREALAKFALSPPSPADDFVAHLDKGKDIPPPSESPVAPPMPEEPAMALGQPTGAMPAKEAALGLKDMLFFENALGQGEAKSMFDDVQRQMSGQGGGRHGTMQFGEGGPRFVPQERPQLQARPQRPAGPPPIPGRIVSSAPPPIPHGLKR